MKRNELTKEEHDAFTEDLTPIVSNTVETLIQLADKHNIDRDSVVEYFCDLFKAISTISTFINYKVKGGEK